MPRRWDERARRKPVRKDLLLSAVCRALEGDASFAPSAAGTPDSSDEFDRTAIDHLIESLSERAVKDLLGEFVDASRARIQELPALLARAEALTIEVHALKSLARQVGAVALSRLAAELERKSAAREAISKDELAALEQHLTAYEKMLAAQGLAA